MLSIGIDYSLTCPAACAYDPDPSKIQFWYAHESKHLNVPNVTVDTIVPGTVVERAARAAYGLCHWIDTMGVEHVAIEDYAYSASGRVFHIGENAGILKYELWTKGIDVTVVAPTTIKKFGTGKGNADKRSMTRAFLDAYPDARAWIPRLFPRTKDTLPANSPLADMADAYWLAALSSSQ